MKANLYICLLDEIKCLLGKWESISQRDNFLDWFLTLRVYTLDLSIYPESSVSQRAMTPISQTSKRPMYKQEHQLLDIQSEI